MSNFDFSLYDPEDETVVSIKKNPQKEKKPQQNPKKEAFSFEQYDYDAPAEPKTKSSNPFAAPEISAEDYINLPWYQKWQHANALEKEQRYSRSKGATKGLASGASFGLSENIPGLESEEDDDWVAKGFGHLLGSALPITGSAKLVGAPIKAAFKYGPKILEPLQHLMHAFGTGTLYESGQQGANYASGKEVDLTQIPKTGATFAALNLLGQVGGTLKQEFSRISPAHQAQILEQGIIPADLPKSQFETAEEAIRLIRGQQRPPNYEYPVGGTPPPPGSPGAPPPLSRGRITAPQDIGLRPVNQAANAPLQDRVGGVFSPNRFYNTTEAGRSIKNEIMALDEEVYAGVGEMYNNSRELNRGVEAIHEDLVDQLIARRDELRVIPDRSSIQDSVLRSTNRLLRRLARFEEGEIAEYLPINNQTLIDQVQSLRQKVDFDFAHGKAKNIFRPLINNIQDSVINAAEASGNAEAATAFNEARAAYRTWTEAFDNDYINPFRNRSNQDFSKLYKSSLDLDESNMVRRILNISENGQMLGNASVRDIAEKNLSKFFENPRGMNIRDFDASLRELEAVATPEQLAQVRQQFVEAQQRPIRARQAPRRQPTNDENIASRYIGKEPEDIQALMNKRSSIRQLREDLSNTPAKRQVFERLQQQKMRSILREGNIEKEFTGDDLYKFLNKEHNFELFSEFLGETETEALRQSAKEIGKQQVKSEMRNKNLSKLGRQMAGIKTLELVLGLLL